MVPNSKVAHFFATVARLREAAQCSANRAAAAENRLMADALDVVESRAG